MNMPNPRTLAAALALLAVAACTTVPSKPDGAVAVREKLSQLQADPALAGRAPVALKDAEDAVRIAETPTSDVKLAHHRVTIADRKVDIARAQAQSRLAEDELKGFAGQRDAARLDARTREADNARRDATTARSDADAAREDAAYANREAALAQQDVALAQQDTAQAQQDTAQAQQQSADLEQQLRELNAKTTDRGIVVTLGDVLFATGGSKLNGATPANLDKLADFLTRHPDRTVLIEGHTDSVGSTASNVSLSQRRADSVKGYLVSHGVSSARLTTSGAGESTPVSDNASATGRQQNRRVEVIISNTETSQR